MKLSAQSENIKSHKLWDIWSSVLVFFSLFHVLLFVSTTWRPQNRLWDLWPLGRCAGWGRDCCEQKNFQVFKHFENDLFIKIKAIICNWIIFLFGKTLPPSWFLGMSGGLQITWTGPTSDHPVHPIHLVIQNTSYMPIHPIIKWLSNNWFQQAFLNFKGHLIYETEKAEVMFKMTKNIVCTTTSSKYHNVQLMFVFVFVFHLCNVSSPCWLVFVF